MTKGCYTVGDNPSEQRRRDTSYRSFICVLLIFLFICLIILLASINWGHRQNDSYSEKDSSGENLARTREDLTENIDKNEYKPNKSDKIKMSTEKEWNRLGTTLVYQKEDHDQTTEVSKIIHMKTEKNHIFTEGPDETKDEEANRPLKEEFDSTTENKVDTTTVNVTTEKIYIAANETETTVDYSYLRRVDGRTEETKNTTDITTEENLTEVYTKTEKIYISTNESDNTTENNRKEDIVITEETKTTFETETPATDINQLKENSTEITETDRSKLQEKNDVFNSTTTEETSTDSTEDETIIKIEQQEERLSTTIKTSTVTEPLTLLPLTTSTPTTKLLPPTTIRLSSSTTTTQVTTEAETEPSINDFISSLAKTKNPVCDSAICKTASSWILSRMNHSVEPCDDFYEFACGHNYESEDESTDFRAVKLLEDELFTIDETSFKFLRDFKNFHQSCLRHEDFFNYTDRLRGVEDLVNAVGEFQLGNETVDYDLTELVSSLILRQSMPLFDIAVDVDKQSSKFILQLNLPQQSFLRTDLKDWSGLELIKQRCLQEQQPSLRRSQIDLTDVYKLYQNCQADYSLYLDSVEEVIRGMKPFSDLGPVELFAIIKEIRFTIEFEVLNNLDILPSSADILSNFVKKDYEIRKVSDLQLHFPLLQWNRLFEILTGHQVQDNSLVQVYFSDYFKTVFGKLGHVDHRKLNNAFLAIFAYDLFVNTVIPKQNTNRNVFCTDLSKKLLPDVWSYFVSVKTPSKLQDYANKKITDVFEELKKNFCKSLMTPEWIDDNTRIQIVKKCNALNLALFKHLDRNSLEFKYSTINVTSNYQTNLITLLTNFRKMVLATEGTHLSDDIIFSYFLDPLSIKPLTFYANPMIAVPFGVIRKVPSGLPDYLLKSRIGFILARQLARHFDPTGIKYNIQLTSTSKSSYSDFILTMTTLMDYSSPRMFLDKNISFVLNGSLSNNERIVDNTAFRLIFDSLKFTADEDLLPWISSQYSREKVFFIATAQELCMKTSIADFMLQVFEQRHLPAALRVENIVGNSEQFSSRFSCPDGSGMVLTTQVQFPFIPLIEEEYQDQADDPLSK